MACLLTFAANLLILSGLAMADDRLDKLNYVGCFDLSYSLSKDYHEHMPNISMTGCVETCIREGPTRYVGIESSDNFCYCGGDIAEASNKKDDNLCNVPCVDQSNRTCGGDWLMSVYDTNTNMLVQEHNDSVSFLIGLSNGIRVYNSSNLPAYESVMYTGSGAWAYTVDYHYAKRLVFANTRGKLVMVGVSSSFSAVNTTPSVLRAMSNCDGFAVDWVIDKIYWANCVTMGAPALMKMDLDGGNGEEMASLGGSHRSVKRMEVDPYNGMLFWLADGVIETFNLTSKVFHANVSGEGIVVRALALDRSAQRVYYTGALGQITPLFSMDYNGRSQLKIFWVPQMQSVFGLGLHGGFVYWINYALSTDVIYKAPLELGAGRKVKMLQTVEKAVWHMRVVHPDLQKLPERDPCASKGCSYFCKVISSTYADCQCPEGFKLVGDGVTCETNTPTTTTATPETPHFGNVTYVGCFGTDYAIGKKYNHKIHYITLGKCISRCVELKKNFAGIGARDMTCYCGGSDLATYSSKAYDIICSDHCPGSPGPELYCGGDWFMSLYDVTKMLPQATSEEGSVSFLVGHTTSVTLYNSSYFGTSRHLTTMPYQEWAYNVDYHYKKNLMFVATRKSLYMSSLFRTKEQRASPPQVVMNMMGCEGFAVDWEFDRIFWADCSEDTTSIKVVDLEGKNATVIWRLPDGDEVIKRMEVDPYSGLLFWTRTGVVDSCDTTGQNFHNNVSSSQMDVRGFALDISKQRLYYSVIDASEGTLFSVDYKGNDLRTHFNVPQMRNVFGLGVIRGYVYWINYRVVDVLHKAPLELTSTRVQQLKIFTSDSTVWHMRVMDPDLQKRPSSILCSAGGSSCLAHNMPITTENNVAGAVLLGVFIFVGVVLVVGLLMFLTDMRSWDDVRAKLPRVPYTRERGVETTTYDINEDSVNLI